MTDMKKLKIYLEFSNAALDEDGNPLCAGLCMTLGGISEKGFEEKYAKLMKEIKIESILKIAALDGIVNPSDCRIISEEEYNGKYGEDD